MASNQRRTEDLLRVKTRELVFQNRDGSYPLANAVPRMNTGQGSVGWSRITIDASSNMTIPGNLNVVGTSTINNVDIASVLGDFEVKGALVVDLSANIKGDLDVSGNADVKGTLLVGAKSQSTQTNLVSIFTNPGIYTVPIPTGATRLYFEMIGAGGAGTALGINNFGGYINGAIDISLYSSTLTIQVGGFTNNPYSSATASYITIPNTGPLFAIAGAGGNAVLSATVCDGGYGGGGAFTNISGGMISFGGNGVDYNSGTTGGGGGTTIGGLAGSNSSSTRVITPGASRATPETYTDASGGLYIIVDGSIFGSGGSGYTGGGGSFGGGGGGSSYVNSLVTVTTSYAGNALPENLLPRFGRSKQGGYVRLSFNTPVSPFPNSLYVTPTATYSNFFTNNSAANVFASYTAIITDQNIVPGDVSSGGLYVQWTGPPINDGTLGVMRDVSPSLLQSSWQCNISGVYIISLNLFMSGTAGQNAGLGVYVNVPPASGSTSLNAPVIATFGASLKTGAAASYTTYLAKGSTVIIAGSLAGFGVTPFYLQPPSTLTFTRIC